MTHRMKQVREKIDSLKEAIFQGDKGMRELKEEAKRLVVSNGYWVVEYLEEINKNYLTVKDIIEIKEALLDSAVKEMELLYRDGNVDWLEEVTFDQQSPRSHWDDGSYGWGAVITLPVCLLDEELEILYELLNRSQRKSIVGVRSFAKTNTGGDLYSLYLYGSSEKAIEGLIAYDMLMNLWRYSSNPETARRVKLWEKRNTLEVLRE